MQYMRAIVRWQCGRDLAGFNLGPALRWPSRPYIKCLGHFTVSIASTFCWCPIVHIVYMLIGALRAFLQYEELYLCARPLSLGSGLVRFYARSF